MNIGASDIFIFIGKTLGLIEIALSAVMFLFHASIHVRDNRDLYRKFVEDYNKNYEGIYISQDL